MHHMSMKLNCYAVSALGLDKFLSILKKCTELDIFAIRCVFLQNDILPIRLNI